MWGVACFARDIPRALAPRVRCCERWLVKSKLILAALFFCICFGLGYAPLNRYDPTTVKGLSDTDSYSNMVDARPAWAPQHRVRILVPMLARPIYRAAIGRVGSWNPALFALLVINSAFVAWAALLLLTIGERITRDPHVAIIASLLYLLSFDVTNFHLAGLVDSVEAWALLAVTWALLTRRWLLVPLIGFVGALGKETSIPLLLVFCGAWIGWLTLTRSENRPPYWAIAALLLAQIIGIEAVGAAMTGHLVAPWKPSAQRMITNPLWIYSPASMIRELLYSFVWLVPLGILRLKELPREWVFSAGASLLMVYALTAWFSVGENATRPAFNIAGPILALSAAILLNRILQPAPASTHILPDRPSEP